MERRNHLYDFFQQSSSKFSSRTAVIYDDDETCSYFSYNQLLQYSNNLAGQLRVFRENKNGVVGLFTAPCCEVLVGILGILQVSAPFLPISSNALQWMNKYIIDRLGIKLVVLPNWLHQVFLRRLESHFEIELLGSVKCGMEMHGLQILKLHPVVTSAVQELPSLPGLAYVLHTSGTTGHPKVVRVPHTCIIPNILHLSELFSISSTDVIFNAAPLTFDTSIVEIFLALGGGARLLMVPDHVKLTPSKLADSLKMNMVTVLQATPTLVNLLGPYLKSTVLSSEAPLRVLAFGGEPCPSPVIISSWRETGNQTKFYNLYGITEVSSWASCHSFPEAYLHLPSIETSVPLGEPLQDTILQVRDEAGLEIHSGLGELYIGGEGRVCLVETETYETAPSMRRTGDLVKINDGCLEYCGRVDDQFKRFGKRTSLTEIEKMLLTSHHMITFKAHLDTRQEPPKLFLFYVPNGPKKEAFVLTIDQSLEAELHEILPPHCIPDHVFRVSKLPMTAHGKVDTKGLILQANQILTSGKRDNSEDILETFENMLKEALLLQDASVIDWTKTFVEAGGDSFQAVRLFERIETCFPNTGDDLFERILNDSLQNVSQTLHKSFRSGGNENFVDANQSKQQLHINFDEKSEKQNSACLSKNVETSPFLQDADVEINDVSKDCMPTSSSTKESEVIFKRGSVDHFINRKRLKRGLSEIKLKHFEKKDKVSLNLSEIWKFDTGKCVDASPLIVKDERQTIAYVGSHSHILYAIDVNLGELIWQKELGDRIESSACLSPCFQFVVVGCYDHCVYFLEQLSGILWWKFETNDSVKSSPVCDKETGLVFIGSHDKCVYGLDALTRTCRWKVHCGSGSVFSSPCIHLATVYAATLGGHVCAIDKTDGTLQWTYSCPKPVFSSPTASQQSVIVGCVNGMVYCIDHKGTKRWNFLTGGPIFSSSTCIELSVDVSVQNYIAIGSHDNCVYCLKEGDGSLFWKVQMPSHVYSTAFVFNMNVPEYENRVSSEDCHGPYDERKLRCSSREGKIEFGENNGGIDSRYSEIQGLSLQATLSDLSAINVNEVKRRKVTRCEEVMQRIKAGDVEGNEFVINEISMGQDIDLASLCHPQPLHSRNSFLCVCSTNGEVKVLDANNGDTLATFHLPGQVFSSPVLVNRRVPPDKQYSIGKNAACHSHVTKKNIEQVTKGGHLSVTREGLSVVVGCRDNFVYCLHVSIPK